MSQTCGIPGREKGEDWNVGGALLSLDQEKAFDRIEWPFVLAVLQQMNFGSAFCQWIRVLHPNIFSRVQVNGFTSELLQVSRGVRQGCPLSPLLYVLVSETLARAIISDPAIDDFPMVDGTHKKLCQYADDTSLLVCSDQSLLSVFALFDRYERASGAKLNIAKSKGLLFDPGNVGLIGQSILSGPHHRSLFWVVPSGQIV